MKSFKFTNNLLHWRIDCFGLEATMNAKRGVKGLKIALIHPLFSHSTSLVGDEKQEKLSLVWSLLMYFLSRDNPWRAVVWLWHYKGQSHDVDVRVNRVYTYAPIPGDQASLKITAFDGLIFFISKSYIQNQDRKRGDKKSFSCSLN